MKELIKRLRRSPTASEFLCLSDLYGKMHEERVEAADALERLTAENDGHKISITCYQAQVDDLTAERDALRELMNCYNIGGWTDSLALIKERDALRAGLAAALDFAGTVAGGSSWWEDVWKEHDAAIAGEKHD